MRIDVHAHYNPPDYFAALRAAGGSEELSIFRALGHIWKPGSATAVMGADKATLKRRLDDMDAAEINKQILTSAPPIRISGVRTMRCASHATTRRLRRLARRGTVAPTRLRHAAAAACRGGARRTRPRAGPARCGRPRARRLRSADPARRREILAALGGTQPPPRRRLHPSSAARSPVSSAAPSFTWRQTSSSPAEIAVCAGRIVATGLLIAIPTCASCWRRWAAACRFWRDASIAGSDRTIPNCMKGSAGSCAICRDFTSIRA